MYKFKKMKNREDVIALRWPKACLSCGIGMPAGALPRHGIVGMFHVDKKTSPGDKRQTQVLLKLPGFFYMCKDCTQEIHSAAARASKELRELIQSLHQNPWTEFIELETRGQVKIPEGVFREKLQEANPDALLKTKPNPMTELNTRLEKR
ncbi:MAG: hypothetical protein ACFE7R_07260 [Candidatus Hodarchaeota archaeon]